MSYTIEYLLIGAFALTGAYLAYDYTTNSSEIIFTSQHDQIQSEKRKAGELLTIIDFLDNPLRMDVLNTGNDKIIIKKMFVDGILDESYTIDGIQTDTIPLNEIVIIHPTNSNGKIIKIITENNNEHSLGKQ